MKQLARYFYCKLKHRNNVRFSMSTVIGRSAKFEGYNVLGPRAKFTGIMGRFSYVGGDSELFATIGRFTSIGTNVKVLFFRHPTTYPYVSTSPAFFSTKDQCGDHFANRSCFEEYVMADPATNSAIIIGNDCWINSNVTFSSNIKVGDGAVVLAGSMVTKDVPPYAVVGGVPAKVIRYRYSDEDIKWLLEKQWWNRDIEWLRKNWEAFNDMDKLKTIL